MLTSFVGKLLLGTGTIFMDVLFSSAPCDQATRPRPPAGGDLPFAGSAGGVSIHATAGLSQGRAAKGQVGASVRQAQRALRRRPECRAGAARARGARALWLWTRGFRLRDGAQ